jgi:hypothetical protein
VRQILPSVCHVPLTNIQWLDLLHAAMDALEEHICRVLLVWLVLQVPLLLAAMAMFQPVLYHALLDIIAMEQIPLQSAPLVKYIQARG